MACPYSDRANHVPIENAIYRGDILLANRVGDRRLRISDQEGSAFSRFLEITNSDLNRPLSYP